MCKCGLEVISILPVAVLLLCVGVKYPPVFAVYNGSFLNVRENGRTYCTKKEV